jgi:hypothetical protein
MVSEIFLFRSASFSGVEAIPKFLLFLIVKPLCHVKLFFKNSSTSFGNKYLFLIPSVKATFPLVPK